MEVEEGMVCCSGKVRAEREVVGMYSCSQPETLWREEEGKSAVGNLASLVEAETHGQVVE